jgi:hypothetical protein
MLTCAFMLIWARYNFSVCSQTDSQPHPNTMSKRRPKSSFQDAVLILAKPYSGLPPFFFHSTGQSQSNIFPAWILLRHPTVGHCSQNLGHCTLMADYLLTIFFWQSFCNVRISSCMKKMLTWRVVTSSSQPRHNHVTNDSGPCFSYFLHGLLNTSDLLRSSYNYLRLTLYWTISTDKLLKCYTN